MSHTHTHTIHLNLKIQIRLFYVRDRRFNERNSIICTKKDTKFQANLPVTD